MMMKSLVAGVMAGVLWASNAAAAYIEGIVVGVSDGDTVTVLDRNRQQHQVRLLGIDAPEKRQDFGERSKRALSDMVFQRQVVVEFKKTDRYGRTVGKITVEGFDANLAQVRAGMAWHYKMYEREQTREDRAAYKEAEDLARTERRGIWSLDNAMTPWEYRAMRRAQ